MTNNNNGEWQTWVNDNGLKMKGRMKANGKMSYSIGTYAKIIFYALLSTVCKNQYIKRSCDRKLGYYRDDAYYQDIQRRSDLEARRAKLNCDITMNKDNPYVDTEPMQREVDKINRELR